MISRKVEVFGISLHGIWLFLGDSHVFLPFKDFPWFRDARVAAVLHVERPEPHHLYWPDLDVDVEVDSIMNPERYPLISREQPKGPLQRPPGRRRARREPASKRPRHR